MSCSPGRSYPILTLFVLLLTGLISPFIVPQYSSTSESNPTVLVLQIDGSINPAVGDYIMKGFDKAAELQAGLVLITMDTPGGLDASMRDIIRTILGSKVPVITYVTPDGARAASAGTYILYASHIAAMAPATNLGAATPVQIGGLNGSKGDDEDQDSSEYEEASSALTRKITNDASAYIKALAERHGRNADWAVRAVREAVSLSATEALELNVINIVAEDLEDLLDQLDGWELEIGGDTMRISTQNIRAETIEPSWRYRILGIISDPNIAYMLLLLGFYGLVYELANPGFLLPGVAGAIALMLALYAFQVLPVNYSGLALMVLGVGFFIGEAFLPSFGTLGIGGIVAFTVGSLILVNEESLRVSLPLVLATAAVSAIFIVLLAGRTFVMRTKRIHTGREAMVGMVGEARTDIDGSGLITVQGEAWNAKSDSPIQQGEKVRILSIIGLDLIVEPIPEDT